MGSVINLLAPKIPDVDCEVALQKPLSLRLPHSDRCRKAPADHVDALSGRLSAFERASRILDLSGQGRLACPRFTHDEQFGFAQVIDPLLLPLTPVVLDGIDALLHHLWRRDLYRVPTNAEYLQIPQPNDV
jgi:hypothetical protein